MGIVTDIIYIVLIALFGGILAHLFKQPLIFGYILAGIVVGPHTGGFTIERIHDIEMLAEIGVALLLFTLGLEFSFGELRRLARITFLGTPIQILLCTFLGYFVAYGLSLSWGDSIWIGAAISLSSTMVVLKTLAARNELDTTAGRVMLAVLIAQDLAIVPMMLILPELTSARIDFSHIGYAILKSALFLFVMYVAGTRLLPRIFSIIAQRGSRELFFLCTLGVALGAGFISYQLGLSFALGAFVAGMLLSETDFNHQALSDVASLRDLFGLIFFVSVGMLFDPHFFISNFGTIITLVSSLVLFKALITGVVVRAFGYDNETPWRVAFGLSQVGEFAFVLGNAGSRSGNLSANSYSLLISVAVVSMIVTPVLFWIGRVLANSFIKGSKADTLQTTLNDEVKGRVVIIGGGVVGQYVARVLETLGRDYIIVESDHKTVLQIRDESVDVIFGDGSKRVILESAGVVHAKLVVITTTNDSILPQIIHEIKALNSIVPIVVRVEEVDDVSELSTLKVHEIVQPQLEVGLEMVRQALLAIGTSEAEIFTLLGQLRHERYEPGWRSGEKRASEASTARASRLLEFSWIDLNDAAPLVGEKLADCRLRERFGVSVVAVLRGNELTANPAPDFNFSAGDALAIIGTEMQLSAFRTGITRDRG